MAGPPSMDEILRDSRVRQRKLELRLGVLILAGGLAFKLGMESLGDGVTVATYGAIGLGIVMIGRGLFGDGRGAD